MVCLGNICIHTLHKGDNDDDDDDDDNNNNKFRNCDGKLILRKFILRNVSEKTLYNISKLSNVENKRYLTRT